MDTLLGDANDAYPGPERPNDADPGRAAWGSCIASTGTSMGCWLLLFLFLLALPDTFEVADT
jgi:hypothetical protein